MNAPPLSPRIRNTFAAPIPTAKAWATRYDGRAGATIDLTQAVPGYPTHPELAALLFEPIATDRRGEVPEGEKPYLEIPVLSWHAGFLTGFYQRQYIDSAQRFPDAPRLTPAHVQALDLFDKLANDPSLHLGMQLQPGDMQFVYNHALLHDRTAFRDWPDASQKRHSSKLPKA